ncbi:cytochrome P450 [Sphingomonas colocasiae]|uniref:Cytochrome P450 n=1 Tax=Sphingomonas colocasiae TaxID=1848973 RepID=A0ABS7PMQ3_9SPHN|nr:cytochrome P450 [Sphingomonas colocasiae]MBY8822592.1 cytochrome P450 [Sphingomonas colocasiae]
MRSPYAIYDDDPPPGVPVLDIDPFETGYFNDPYPAQQAMRDAGPYFWLSRYGVGAVARHDSVRAVLADWRTYCSSRGVGMEDFERHGRFRLRSLILEVDPPEHDAARRVLNRVLSPAVLADLRERFFAAADTMIAELIEHRRFDGIADLARAYPLRVFPDAVGMGAENREKLLPHADALFNSFGPRNALFQASTAKVNFEWIEAQGHRERLAPGGLGMMVHEAADRGEIGHGDAPMLVRALLQAGLDTTINSLAAALHALARFPAEFDRLRASPDLAKNAFEEAVRFESPVQTFFRTVTRPAELGGLPVRAGDKILMFLGAANRDSHAWDAPDRYDIGRRITHHVGFGAGIHGCVGRLLARMEGEAVLTALARRARRILLAGEPVRHYNNTIRSWSSLPMELVPA